MGRAVQRPLEEPVLSGIETEEQALQEPGDGSVELIPSYVDECNVAEARCIQHVLEAPGGEQGVVSEILIRPVAARKGLTVRDGNQEPPILSQQIS